MIDREKLREFLDAWDRSGRVKTSLYWRLLSVLEEQEKAGA